MKRAGAWWLLIAAAILLNGLPWLRPQPHSAGLLPAAEPPAPAQPGATAPIFTEELINPRSPLRMSHVASLCELPGGRLAAVWYAGSREGAKDVAIYLATTQSRGQPGWTPPRAIVTPEQAARDLRRAVRKAGNPVVFSNAAGKLWLLYVTINVGGWSGSSLNLTTSHDGGLTWTPSRRLTLSPFFNISELVRNPPVRLSDGRWLVPIYHECLGKFPELLWLGTAEGCSATKSRITGGRSGFQPALAALSTNAALAFLRDCGPRKRISVARTGDAGRTWSAPEALDLPNPDSGLTSLCLADGRLLLVFNDSTEGRANLRLAVSKDAGQTWKRVATLAEEPGAEFSYPFLLQTRDGMVHLAYTWKRQAIKHAAFNIAWLNTRQSPPAQ